MKLSYRKSWWWLTPLAAGLVLGGIYLTFLHRRNTQARIASRIVELGGAVDVRSEAPKWLFRFASDDCRSRFSESKDVEPIGPEWLRNSLAGEGVGGFINAFDVADTVWLKIVDPPRRDFRTHCESPTNDLPELLKQTSELTSLRHLYVQLETAVRFDCRSLPDSIETIVIVDTGSVRDHLDCRRLPAHLEWLGVHSNRDLAVDFTNETSLDRLEVLDLDGALTDATAFPRIAKATQLKSLDLRNTRVSDADLQYLRGLKNLRLLTCFAPDVTDAGSAVLDELPQLKSLTMTVCKLSRERIAQLELRGLNLQIDRVEDPKSGPEETELIDELFYTTPLHNGFDHLK